MLIRADGAGGTKEFTNWLADHRLSYSVGFTLPMDTTRLYQLVPEQVWSPALDADEQPREGADVAEFTDLLDLTGWPAGMRVIVRRERPHPGAQLRFDDVDGYRLTAFATNTRTGQLQQLELRHRKRARCEDRIRTAKDTGLSNLPSHGFDANRIWCQIVAMASEIQAWTGLLALNGHEARRWEPKKLRYRLYTIPATIARRARQVILHLSTDHPGPPSSWMRSNNSATYRPQPPDPNTSPPDQHQERHFRPGNPPPQRHAAHLSHPHDKINTNQAPTTPNHPKTGHHERSRLSHVTIASPGSTGKGSRSTRLPLPTITTSPARQSMWSNSRPATSPRRNPRRASNNNPA